MLIGKRSQKLRERVKSSNHKLGCGGAGWQVSPCLFELLEAACFPWFLAPSCTSLQPRLHPQISSLLWPSCPLLIRFLWWQCVHLHDPGSPSHLKNPYLITSTNLFWHIRYIHTFQRLGCEQRSGCCGESIFSSTHLVLSVNVFIFSSYLISCLSPYKIPSSW